MRKIVIDAIEADMGFDEALERASVEAAYLKGISPREMIVIAWYDRQSRRCSPEVGFVKGPVVNWALNAVNRGADTWVELGGGRYIFLCRSSRRH